MAGQSTSQWIPGISLVSKQTWGHLGCLVLDSVHTNLRTYTGELIKPLGLMDVVVCYQEQQAGLPLHVVDGAGPSLLCRNWLHTICLDWAAIYIVHTSYSRLRGSWKNTKFYSGLGSGSSWVLKVTFT